MTTQPFSAQATLFDPAVSGAPANWPFPLTLVGQYNQKHYNRYAFTGTGSLNIDLGLLGPSDEPYKFLCILQELVTDAEEVTVTFNAANGGAIPVAPGGWLMIANPVAQPTPDIVVAHTADGAVWVIAYG